MNDDEHYAYYTTKLKEFFNNIKSTLPDGGLKLVESSMNSGEWELAFEDMLSIIVDNNIQFPKSSQRLAEEVAKAMEMEDDEYLVALRHKDGSTR